MPEGRLTAALASWGLGEGTRQPLAGDVSHRRYYRLSGGGLEDTAVAMVSPEAELQKMRDWVSIGRWLDAQRVAVPRTLHVNEDQVVLLITDVGDHLLCDEPEPLPWTRQVTEDLARLEVAPAADDTPAHHRRLEPERIRWELRRFRKVVASAATALDDDERAAWKAGEDALVAGLCGGRQVWMHRDLHSRNLLLRDGRVWWIDFQDAMMGPWLYDLASLVFDPYAALDEAARCTIREHYLALPGRACGSASSAEIERHWLQSAVQRLVHCVACYVWVFEHDGRPLYLKYLPYAMARLREAMADCPAAAPLARVMEGRWDVLFERWSEHVPSR